MCHKYEKFNYKWIEFNDAFIYMCRKFETFSYNSMHIASNTRSFFIYIYMLQMKCVVNTKSLLYSFFCKWTSTNLRCISFAYIYIYMRSFVYSFFCKWNSTNLRHISCPANPRKYGKFPFMQYACRSCLSLYNTLLYIKSSLYLYIYRYSKSKNIYYIYIYISIPCISG